MSVGIRKLVSEPIVSIATNEDLDHSWIWAYVPTRGYPVNIVGAIGWANQKAWENRRRAATI